MIDHSCPIIALAAGQISNTANAPYPNLFIIVAETRVLFAHVVRDGSTCASLRHAAHMTAIPNVDGIFFSLMNRFFFTFVRVLPARSKSTRYDRAPRELHIMPVQTTLCLRENLGLAR